MIIEWLGPVGAFWIGFYVIYRVSRDIYLEYKRGNKGYYEVSGPFTLYSDFREIKRMHDMFPEMRFFINGRRVLFPGDKRPLFVGVYEGEI